MNTLSSRNLIIIVLVIMAASQALYLTFYVFEKEKSEIKNTVFHKVKNINMSLQSSIEFLMRANESEQVKIKITELGIDQEIKDVLLIDSDGNVFASTHLKNIEKKLTEIELPLSDNEFDRIAKELAGLSKISEGKIWLTKDAGYVVSVYPVAAFTQEKNMRFTKTGSIILVHDLKTTVDKIYGLIVRLSIMQLIGLILFGLLLHFVVFRRIAIIRENSEKISQGDYNVTIPIQGHDELSSLSRNIESMAKQVKELLAAVLRNEETFAKAQEIAHIGSWDWDITGGDLSWSDEIYRIFGLKPQQFGATYDAFLKSVHPDDIEAVTSAVNNSVADPDVSYFVEHRVVHPDGNIRDVQEQGKVYRDRAGNPVRMIGTVLDVTERNLMELARTKERYFINAVLESAAALVLVLDNKGRIVRFNNECERISGYTFSEIENKYPWDTVLPKESAEEIYSEAFSGLINNPDKSIGSYKNCWVNKQGEYFFIDWSNSLLFDDNGDVEYVVSVGIDITEKQRALDELEKYRDKLEHLVEMRTKELKDTQYELIRKERLATLGQLTATVSHELRNPLGAMTPSLYVIQKLSNPDDEKLQQAITRIDRNIGRCDRIIDELLDYTRIGSVALSSVEIGPWLVSVLNEQVIPDGIVLLKNISVPNVKVLIDIDVMRRAIINVFENACQSMQDEKDGMRVLDDATLKVAAEITEQKLNIIFQDSGCGMSDEVKSKIFEPLFSTKGFGVGLGMPTVLQIMQQHNGGVEVLSAEGIGTTITLWLPL